MDQLQQEIISSIYNSGYANGYNKAIDDFVNNIKDEINRFEVKNIDTCVLFDFIDRKAEKLKAGASNGTDNQ